MLCIRLACWHTEESHPSYPSCTGSVAVNNSAYLDFDDHFVSWMAAKTDTTSEIWLYAFPSTLRAEVKLLIGNVK